MGSTAKKVDRKYTYADYLAWPDNERWEILNGSKRSPAGLGFQLYFFRTRRTGL